MTAYKSGIFSIDPEVVKRIHPEALEVLVKWEESELPMLQVELTTADTQDYLDANERAESQRCISQIWEGLKTCMDVGDGVTLHDVYVGDIFWKKGVISEFRRTSLIPFFSLKLLLEKARNRKLKKIKEQERREAEEAREKKKREQEQERQRAANAEEERKKKEEQEKWHAAFNAINVPAADASTYLRTPEESEKFAQSIVGAVDAYLDRGESYLADNRSYDYCQWLIEINHRREEEERKTTTKSRAREYNQRLNKEIARLRSLLCPNRKDHQGYFEKKIKDRRYTGENFTQFLSSEEERAFDNSIIKIERRRLHKLVSNDFCEFLDGKYYRSFFLLPSAEYSFQGVPCLDFMFDVFAVVEARVWFKPRQKTFGGYVFNLPWRDEKGYSVLLQEPELLGFDYVVLTPEDIGGYVPWESIPLVLIKGLMNSELQPAGTTILAASENGRTYRIKDFKDEVTIPRSFENYLKKIGNIEQMVSIGIVGQEVANVIKENLGQSSTEQRTGEFQNGQAVEFTDEELISSLTSLGHTRKTSEELCSIVPRKLSLDEAIEFTLQKHSEIIAQQHSMKSQ